jgi:uncharacterized protein (DUF2267 family)
MSTGLAVFDTTIQESNEWLKEMEARLQPCDRQEAYDALRAVLHVLRDRLPPEAVLGLSAQLPMLLRGVFLEGWRPADGPSNARDPLVFAGEVGAELPQSFPREPNAALEAVFQVMAHRLDPGEVHKLVAYMPTPLRPFWPAEYRAH